MKTVSQKNSAPRHGFTIPEFVVTMALTTIVALGMVGGYMFSGRMYALAVTKLETSEDMRGLVAEFAHDVRIAADFDVGTGTATTFREVADGQRREGNAVQIYPTANTNSYWRYFLDTSTKKLRLVESGSTNVYTLATSVTNTLPFTIEDAWGNVATSSLPSEVVGMVLEFSATAVRTGTNANASASTSTSLKEAARLSTRIHRRNAFGYQ